MSGRVSWRAILGVAAALGAAGHAAAKASRCWIDQGALVASASFGDIAGDFIIDTAAPYSLINQTEAQAAGFDGDSTTAVLRIAKLAPRPVRLNVVSLDGLPQTDTAIIGVIGQDVLAPYVLKVQFSPCRLSLTPGSRRVGRRGLTLNQLAGLPAVAAGYGDRAESRREPMLISTGRWESLIPRATLSRTPAHGDQPPVRLGWIDVGGRRIAPAPAGLAASPAGTLGMSVWTRWRGMTLTRHRLFLKR